MRSIRAIWRKSHLLLPRRYVRWLLVAEVLVLGPTAFWGGGTAFAVAAAIFVGVAAIVVFTTIRRRTKLLRR